MPGRIRSRLTYAIAACVAALLLGALAVTGAALASTYSSVPKAGRWTGSLNDNAPVSFTVRKRRHKVTIVGFTAHTHIYCSNGDSPATQVGDLTISDPSPIPVVGNPNSGDRGDVRSALLTISVPGAAEPLSFQIAGLFTSHHQYPPPGTQVGGVIAGTFYKDADHTIQCGLSVSQGDSGAEVNESADWTAHAGG